jgi:hypothetical protein
LSRSLALPEGKISDTGVEVLSERLYSDSQTIATAGTLCAILPKIYVNKTGNPPALPEDSQSLTIPEV